MGNTTPSGGSAYVFTRSGTMWFQQAKLNSNDVAPFDHFGVAVSISVGDKERTVRFVGCRSPVA